MQQFWWKIYVIVIANIALGELKKEKKQNLSKTWTAGLQPSQHFSVMLTVLFVKKTLEMYGKGLEKLMSNSKPSCYMCIE